MTVRCRPTLCLILAAALALAGCAKFLPGRAPKPAPPAPPPAPVVTVKAADLFPAGDSHAVYSLTDQGTAAVTVAEEWFRDGDRLLMATGGVTYAVWYFRSDGVWRADPKGSGLLLRYLPAELTSGKAWVHELAGRKAYFRLSEAAGACQSVSPCWQLEIANGGESTTFLFGGGRGPIRAEAVNRVHPADSFVKSLTDLTGAQVTAQQRQELLAKLPAAPQSSTPVEATWDAVQTALDAPR